MQYYFCAYAFQAMNAAEKPHRWRCWIFAAYAGTQHRKLRVGRLFGADFTQALNLEMVLAGAQYGFERFMFGKGRTGVLGAVKAKRIE
jgi:hypothetical protein